MKPVRKIFGFMGRHAFNVRRWSNYDTLRDSADALYKTGKATFKRPSVKKPETFDEAVKRFSLSEKDIEERYQNCRKIFIIFALFCALLSGYTLYLLIHSTFMGAILAAVVAVLTGLHAFKYHFWMFQIKHHKLGCTFSEYHSGNIKTKNTDIKEKNTQ